MEIFSQVTVADQLGVFVNALIAAVLGGLIGWERDRAGKAAGLRTMAMVSAACAVVVAMGVVVDRNAELGDPTRALHAIITGIGFLGAGLIFTSKRSGVHGVTTAATVWATATVGGAVGLGFHLSAVGLTLLLFGILRSTHVVEVLEVRNHPTASSDDPAEND